jgi:hypothetical protein
MRPTIALWQSQGRHAHIDKKLPAWCVKPSIDNALPDIS